MAADAVTGSSIEDRILAALDEARPHLHRDQGDIDFVRFEAETGVAEVRFTGACSGCAMSAMTLRAGIERIVRIAVPEVRRVEAVR
ncbi:MAG: NifU family protein [Candidatus Kapabacteria bacterium]|nr:NifU family protein [Candidatus Kapabacteria bacterium]